MRGGATIILAPPPSTRKLHNPKNVEQWQLPFIFLYELLPKNINENRWFWHVTSLNETFIAISWRKNPKLLRVYWAPENNVLLLQRGGIGQSIFDSPASVDNVNSWQECGKCQSLMQTYTFCLSTVLQVIKLVSQLALEEQYYQHRDDHWSWNTKMLGF